MPIWLLAPGILHARATKGRSRRADANFLGDVLWGQYCLVMFVRMQDDVMDRQTASLPLMFAADEFLIESERVFMKHLQTPAFWRVFQDALRRTIRGILEVHALQRAEGIPEPSWDAYARVASIFKVGSAAVCSRHGFEDEWVRISRFFDHVAIADQLLDDLCDLDEDLRDGRLNAVARALLGRHPRSRHVRARLAEAIHCTDRLDRLLTAVHDHLRGARAEAASLGSPEADTYLDRFERRATRSARQLHRARVMAIFSPIAADSGKMAE